MKTKRSVQRPPLRIYWDSCVYIHRIQRTAKHIDTLELLGRRIESGDIILVASTLCIAEVSKTKSGAKLTANQLKKIHAFFEHSYIEIYPVTRTIAEYAAEIVRAHDNKPADAIHLATAALSANQVHEFHTYEKRLINFSGQLRPSVLRVCEPNNIGWQGELFSSNRESPPR